MALWGSTKSGALLGTLSVFLLVPKLPRVEGVRYSRPSGFKIFIDFQQKRPLNAPRKDASFELL
jgi:hypothetical protein